MMVASIIKTNMKQSPMPMAENPPARSRCLEASKGIAGQPVSGGGA